MKRNRMIPALFWVVALWGLLLCPVAAAEQEGGDQDGTRQGNTVSTEAQLREWIESNQDIGGTVTLEQDITITNTIYLSVTYHITVDTAVYSLIYDGGELFISDWDLTGQGVDSPVLEVRSIGGRGLHWANAVQSMHITATGREGMGGTTVWVRGAQNTKMSLLNVKKEGEIRAYGEGAVGVYVEEPVEIHCLNVTVQGENSAAVYAPQGAELYYCKLNAQGSGATAVAGGGRLYLENCDAAPLDDSVEVARYAFGDVVGRSFYHPVAQNADYLIYYDYFYTFEMHDEMGSGDKTGRFELKWQPDPSQANLSTLGQQVLRGSLMPPFQGLGLEGSLALELVIDVRDPAVPCISQVGFHDNYLGRYAVLHFWEVYDPAEGDVTLWQSMDGGVSWQDVTEDDHVEWEEGTLLFFYEEVEGAELITLQIEVAGAGESNLATLSLTGGVVGGGIGGDRTGTDRVVVEEKENGEPVEEEPPPEPEEPDEGLSSVSPPEPEESDEGLSSVPPEAEEGGEPRNAAPVAEETLPPPGEDTVETAPAQTRGEDPAEAGHGYGKGAQDTKPAAPPAEEIPPTEEIPLAEENSPALEAAPQNTATKPVAVDMDQKRESDVETGPSRVREVKPEPAPDVGGLMVVFLSATGLLLGVLVWRRLR